MSPEHPVGVDLADPVLVHVGEQVQLAVGLEPFVDGRAAVCRDGSACGGAVGGVGGRLGIILAAAWY